MNLLEILLKPLGFLLRNKRANTGLSAARLPELNCETKLNFFSPNFGPNEEIPNTYCSKDLGPNVSPAFAWSGAPETVRQYLLIMEDPDAPFKEPNIHMLALIPGNFCKISEGALCPDHPLIKYIPGRKGRTGYFGPRPLPGHGTHHYGFYLLALDYEITEPSAYSKFQDLIPDLKGHILAKGHFEAIKHA